MTRVTVDDMVEAIREAKKPVTAAEIAEATDVTRQAIGKRREQLEADDRVEYGKVGSATAYWLKSWVEETDKQPPTEPGAGVLIVLGITLFGAGLTKGMQYLIVETSGEWFRMDIAGPNAFFGTLLVGVFGMVLFSIGGQIAWRAKRRYDYATQ